MSKIIEVAEQRIKANEKMFTKEEMEIIQNNIEMAAKIYSLGNVDTVNAFLNADKECEGVLKNANI